MARVRHVKLARKSKKTRKCRVCGHEIEPGESYKYVAKKTGPRSSITLTWCAIHSPKPSDLLSGRSAELACITEAFESSLSEIDENTEDQEKIKLNVSTLKSICEDTASAVEDLADDIRESAEAIQDGLGHETSQSENMTNTADELETWRYELSEQGENIDAEDEDLDFEDLMENVKEWQNGEPELILTS